MLSIVVLPLPDGPTTNSISPKYASKLTPRTAIVRAAPSPNHFVSSVARIATSAIAQPRKMSKGSIWSTLRTPT